MICQITKYAIPARMHRPMSSANAADNDFGPTFPATLPNGQANPLAGQVNPNFKANSSTLAKVLFTSLNDDNARAVLRADVERGGVAEAFRIATDELAALLGSDIRRHLRPIAASAWSRTEWVNGSYSHALPGQAHARAVLARPIGDRIFFAGEATHTTDFSTAHGAWQSGIRAALEVLERQSA